MHLIACIDDRYGLSFAGRRQSTDHVLTERILTLCENSRLWLTPYSAKLFPADRVIQTENPAGCCAMGEYCFLELEIGTIPRETVESVILCRWNRCYPATAHFPRELLAGFRLVSVEHFPGNSHEKITVERYMP